MRLFFFSITILLVLIVTFWPADRNAKAQEGVPTATLELPPVQGISSPVDGAVVNGIVNITGTSSTAWELSFSYRDNPVETWFLLAQSTDPVSEQILFTWDTGGLTNGYYRLRLIVIGSQTREEYINLVLVDSARNLYDPTQTESPVPIGTATPDALATTMKLALTLASQATLTPTPGEAQAETTSTPELAIATLELEPATETATPVPPILTEFPLRSNPALITDQDMFFSIARGAVFVLVFFFAAGAAVLLTRKKRNR